MITIGCIYYMRVFSFYSFDVQTFGEKKEKQFVRFKMILNI